ncbi:MAG TPA: AAA family ATPase [Pyrinomonadaceae bacterium]|jgi:MoxR-like ATPase|nr:AAA family ATPase [Pyrinomonadaceae bacterium]
MTINQSAHESASSLRSVISSATAGLVEREALVEMVALSAVAEEHVLVIGPPGTAKSEAVRRIARATGGQYFEYLLGRFTEPSEIFGPVDLHKLKDGLVETDTLGMLPEADIAFLDEIFQGSTAILNTLLGILNERVFRRGHTNVRCPLRVCVGASNSLPDDTALAAFADRFLVRCFVDPIPDPMLEQLLESGWSLNQSPSLVTAGLNDMEVLTVAARKADMSGVRPHIAQAIRTLRGAGITLTDRRAVRAQKLIAAAALMAGRDKPTEADLWPLIFVLPTREQQSLGRDSLRDLLSATENATLPVAAEEASLGPLARATRVAQAARQILGAQPGNGDGEQSRAWRLQLEGVAREIDAGFTPEQMPDELVELRIRIIEVLGQSS